MLKKVMLALLALALIAAAQEPQPAAGTYTPRYPGDPAHSQSEAIALGYIHTVITNEKLYLKKHTRYAPSLYALSQLGSGSFTKRMAKTDRGDYTVSYRGAETKYALQLTPKQYDAQHRAFWVNETGIVHVEGDHPATQESPVLRPD
jgi:hypothetical protein